MTNSAFERDVAYRFIELFKSARDRKKPFELTLNSVRAVLKAKKCYYTGLPFTKEDPVSFDRVDNSQGYILGNVVACRRSVNLTKANLEMKMILQLAAGVAKHQKRKVNGLEK
jgi:hypothetical protein